MKSRKYFFTIICISLSTLGQGEGKIGHFDRNFLLKKMAENQQVTRWGKKGLLDSASVALKLASNLTSADSAKADSIFLAVIKKGGYQYVFNADYLLAVSANSNLSCLVAKQLRIAMPDSNICDLITTNRIAYCNRDSVLAQLPEIRAADSLLVIFQNDTLSMEYDNLLAEFNRHDSLIKVEHGYFSSSLLKKSDLLNNLNKIQNWVNYSAKKVQEKKFVLLKPYYDQIESAIKKVAAKERYDYVFRDNFHYQGVKDISSDVIKELRLANM